MDYKNFNVYTKIVVIALLSRTLIIIVSYLPSLIFESFDKSTSLSTNRSIFKHLLRWDAIHFLHIADHGYTYEHSIPFFPLTPLIVRVLPFWDNFTKAVLFNSLTFIVSAALLYKVSIQKYSHRFSYLSTLFFIFNPASIIYVSFYSESLFCMLFMMGFYYILTNRMLKASILFGLCSLTRSNTVMLLIFFKSIYFLNIILPLALYQFYNLMLIWRSKGSFFIIVPYSYIQIYYWQQGFLNFIRPWNIPNMLFGIFGIAYGYYIVKKYFESRLYILNTQRRAAPLGEVSKSAEDAAPEQGTNASKTHHDMTMLTWVKNQLADIKHALAHLTVKKLINYALDPFLINQTSSTTKLVIILGFQVFTLIFFIHWNVAFRFISYNPFIYWAFAALSQRYFNNSFFRMVAAVFFGYGMIYAVLFGVFYPPA